MNAVVVVVMITLMNTIMKMVAVVDTTITKS
jgi:hypothetical protein